MSKFLVKLIFLWYLAQGKGPKKTKKQICVFFIHGKGREEYIRNNSCKCIELNKAKRILENQK